MLTAIVLTNDPAVRAKLEATGEHVRLLPPATRPTYRPGSVLDELQRLREPVIRCTGARRA